MVLVMVAINTIHFLWPVCVYHVAKSVEIKGTVGLH